MNLKDYIGEATAYDKKLMLEHKDPTSWLKSVSAFANTQGGRLLFSVANDGALVGLTKAHGTLDALDDDEFSGGLLSLLEVAKNFVKTNSKSPWKKLKNGDGRVEYPEYPADAVEESIVNVLIHRDYLEIGSEVHIDMFDDRLEVYSPGGMPSGELIQDLDAHYVPSTRRNPVIADLFQRLDLMERRGSGFKKILGAYAFESEKRNATIRPEFRSIRSAFFAVLPNLNYGRAIGQVAGQVTDQVAGQVADQLTDALNEIADSLPVNAKRLLRILETDMDFSEIMSKIQLSSRGHLRKTALNPALESGLVEMTQPDSPRSPTQKYRLTAKGRELRAYYVGTGTDGKFDGAMPSCTTTKTTNKATNNPTTKTTTKTITETITKTISKEAEKILRVLAENNRISAQQLGRILGLSVPGVRYHLKLLTKKFLIRRVGSSKGGHWEVVK